MQNIDLKIELWKKRLLDLGKGNRLINFKETKLSNIKITSPCLGDVFNDLVIEEKSLSFSNPLQTVFDENIQEQSSSVVKGEIETNQTINELKKTLTAIKAKSKTSIEEKGINTLYLTFGMIKWKETINSDEIISSPLVLVPVNIKVDSINEPYVLTLHNDEVLVNPSLAFKFENDFGITLPEFDEHINIREYLSKVADLALRNGWEVTHDVYLALLSFLKINMYEDMDKSRDKILSNPFVKSLAGDLSEIIQAPQDLNNYDHDKNTNPVDSYQVVDADSSQQDAILLSKRGISFVLQGPPGTGKSQTITNIIAEAMADGKKVLFVSEKMAALEVVKKRLTEVKLNDFCLTLHSYRANKKDVLSQLESTLKIAKINVQDDMLYKLTELEEKRKKLNEYQQELHAKCMPLNATIYEINGRLAKLDSTEDIIFSIEDVKNTDPRKLNKYKYLISEYAESFGSFNKDGLVNPWNGCNIPALTHDMRRNIDARLSRLLHNFKIFTDVYEEILNFLGADFDNSIENAKLLIEILNQSIKSPIIPANWLNSDIDELIGLCNQLSFKCSQYFELKDQLKKNYDLSVFNVSSDNILAVMGKELKDITDYINSSKYSSDKEIVINASFILSECSDLKDILSSCVENSETVYELLNIKKPENINSLIQLDELVKYIRKNPKPTEKWFNDIQLSDALKILKDANEHQTVLNQNVQKVRARYDEKIIDIDYEEYIKRFNEKYRNTIKIISTFNKIDDPYTMNKQIIHNFKINQNQELLKCRDILKDSVEIADKVAECIGINKIKNIDELISLGELMGALSNMPQVVASWFDSRKDFIIDKMIQEIKLKLRENKEMTDSILSKYSRDIFDIDYKGMLARFNTEYTGIFKHVKGSYKSDKKEILSCNREVNIKISDTDIVSLLVDISDLKENEQWLRKNHQDAKELLGELYQDGLTDWEAVEKSRENFHIIKDYFGDSKVPALFKSKLIECKFDEINEACSSLNKDKLYYMANIIYGIMCRDYGNIHIDEALTEIDDVYSNTIGLSNDYSFINNFKLNKNMDDGLEDVVNILNDVKQTNTCRDWFEEKSYLLVEYLGSSYIGVKTDFENIRSSIDVVNKIKSLLENNVPTELILMLTKSDYPIEKFTPFQESISKLDKSQVSDRLDFVLKCRNNKFINVNEIFNALDNVICSITLIGDSYKQFVDIAHNNMQFESVKSDIISLNKIQKIEQAFASNEKELNNKLSFKYKGVNTNWDVVIKNLEYAKQLNEICSEYSLPEKFAKAVCNDIITVETSKKYLDDLNGAKKIIHEDLQWFTELFKNKTDIYSMSIYDAYDKIKNCMNLASLEDWLDYASARKECVEFGLVDFIEHIEKLNIKENDILNIFLKRFYKLWLDETLPKYPTVHSFRSQTQHSIINDFNELDKLQLEIARLRIREKLIDSIPDMNVTTSSLDEVGILKRELDKQRGMMPLRQLFKLIPNLLTTLKPCMMMSPLSVSLYLSEDRFEFDTVIFDEASQICTENAIGAIIRGKQVIIVGDRYQLPPTNFFNAAYSDNVVETEDEDICEELDTYDSILDEAANAISERTLKWHYRSRYENLIAFSNSEIYKNELTTFPSNINNFKDRGVEYIYVEDGIYNRGTHKNNVNEARRVAKLVFEHFDQYPERSIGVVTFSTAQQQAIESAIRQKRLADPSYEEYFKENKPEEFFVKNLENVQGDERDTIIFSIGYGKDSNGNMYMNFGPLSRNGGYRRLNVAITRAKFNLKLVGSILPRDINIEKTNSQGVKMLKNYIEFAMNEYNFLQTESAPKNVKGTDSPFEQAVYEFLTKNGYCVKTKVGCSGYRIDLAVEHPLLRGAFVLCIECDGHIYHSARTARERDRLRQSVLEDMGWVIYRVWSTEWTKDTKTEGAKLLKAVEKAIANFRLRE